MKKSWMMILTPQNLILEENAINYCPDECDKFLKKLDQERAVLDKLIFSKEDSNNLW